MGTGITAEVFHAVGTVPILMERLRSLVRTGDILEASKWSITPVMSSEPLALEKSDAFISSKAYSSVQQSLQDSSLAGGLVHHDVIKDGTADKSRV